MWTARWVRWYRIVSVFIWCRLDSICSVYQLYGVYCVLSISVNRTNSCHVLWYCLSHSQSCTVGYVLVSELYKLIHFAILVVRCRVFNNPRRHMPWLHAPISSSRCRPSFRRFKNLVPGNRTECACLFCPFSSDRVLFLVSQKTHHNLTPIRTSSENNYTSDEEIGACSHGFMRECSFLCLFLRACFWLFAVECFCRLFCYTFLLPWLTSSADATRYCLTVFCYPAAVI